MSMGQWWNDDWQGKTEELGEKPASIPLRPTRISLEVTRELYRLNGVAVLQFSCPLVWLRHSFTEVSAPLFVALLSGPKHCTDGLRRIQLCNNINQAMVL
jgi:hypothetical protein